MDRAIDGMGLGPDIQCRVNAGGDLRVAGPRAERAALRAVASGGALIPVLEIENGSIASSSGQEGHRRVQGHLVGPHLDGVRRRTVGTRSFVSVVAEQCTVADALTKVVLAKGQGGGAGAAPLRRDCSYSQRPRRLALAGDCRMIASPNDRRPPAVRSRGPLRLSPWRLWTLYTIAAGVWLTGILWLIYHYFLRQQGPIRIQEQSVGGMVADHPWRVLVRGDLDIRPAVERRTSPAAGQCDGGDGRAARWSASPSSSSSPAMGFIIPGE